MPKKVQIQNPINSLLKLNKNKTLNAYIFSINRMKSISAHSHSGPQKHGHL